MNEMLDLNAIVEIAFVLFVIAICARALKTHQAGGAQLADAWKDELNQLATSLRDLVDEAAASSRNLDRRLAQRQKDLEQLLKEIESKTSFIRSQIEDDLPNETWLKESPQKVQPRKAASDQTSVPSSKQKVEQVLRQRREKEELTQQRKTQPKAELAKSLASQVEVSNENEAELFRNNPTSITDAVAFSIAKRLLLAGKELHVVARKLEVPIAEIRELDIYLRNNQSTSDADRVKRDVVELQNEIKPRGSSLEALVDEIEDRTYI